MLYYLFFELLRQYHPAWGPLRIFGEVSFRTILAAITSLVISLAFGSFAIEKLQQLKFGQEIREEGVRSHQSKRGTPTMGGVLMLVAVTISTLLWSNLKNLNVWLVLFALLAHGGIGFIDDYLKIAKKHNLGLSGRHKLIGQFFIALIIGAILIGISSYSTTLSVPFFKNFRPDLGWFIYIAFILVVLVGSSNAVNLTDGLDGLAVSTSFIVIVALSGFTYVTGYVAAASYLGLTANPMVLEVTIFCAALGGACLGFLWFNAPPAEVFMGDVGSLAIGGSIGCVAVIIKQELLLVVIGGVFVIEALSVILQTSYYKMTKDPKTGIGRRIFKMSPLHHHFELVGWKEPKIVFRFIILQIFFVLLSLVTLKLR